MFNFILGGCGTGKSTELMEKIKKDVETGKSVLVLFPEEFSFEAEKRLYDFLGVELFNRLKTYSFYTLSQDILRRCGSAGKRYATEQEKLLFLWQAVQACTQRSELKLLYKQQSPESLMSLQKLVIKMRREGITPERIRDISPVFTSQLRDKVQDICCILTAYDEILQKQELSDSLTDLTGAAISAGKHKFFVNQRIYVDEFGVFTGDQYQMLDVMMHQAEEFTIAIRSDQTAAIRSEVFEGGNQTFENLKRTAQEISPNAIKIHTCEGYKRSKHEDLKAIAEQIFQRPGEPVKWQGHVHMMQADDPESEVEYICGEIYRLLSKNSGMRCRDIAIAVKEPEVYRPLLERAFARYALPYDIAAEKSVLHKEVIRSFLTLMEILSAKDWRTEAILKYLKNGFAGADMETVSMLEHYCFTWSIDRDDWTKAFYDSEKPEVNHRSEQFGGQVIETLRRQFISEMQELKAQCENADVRKICRMIYTYLHQKEKAYEEQFRAEDVLKRNEHNVVWEMLCDTMNTVVETMGAEKLSLKNLTQIFLILLKSSNFSTPPETLDSIRVVETLYEHMTVRLNSPEVVFVPGVIEGVFPGDIQPNSVFSQQELQALEKQHIQIAHLLPELYSDELLIINKILASPSEQLYLTYPEINAEHELTQPSLIIEAIRRMFTDDEKMLIQQKDIPLTFYAWTKPAAYFHYVRHLHDDDEKRAVEAASLKELLSQDDVYGLRVQKLSEQPSEQKKNASPEMMKKLLGSPLTLSSTGIESFYQCPFAYFCMKCLRLYAPEKVTFGALNIGNFAHYCLEKIISSHPEDFTELSEKQLSEEVQEAAEQFRKERFSASVLKDGRFQLNYDMHKKSILKQLKHIQQELKKSAFTPTAFEAKIDEQGTFRPYSLDEGKILCKGTIDRVDICQTDEQMLMRVVDYKTSAKKFAPEKLASGIDMQMLIYLLTLEQNEAFKAEPAGVLYLPGGQPKSKHYEERKKKHHSEEEILQKYYQMTGLMLEKSQDYIEDSAEVLSVTEEEFAHLREHVEKKICEMAEKLYQGEISPEPYLYGDRPPCQYCPCADICGHAETETLKLTDEQKAEALRLVFGSKEKEEEEDGMD